MRPALPAWLLLATSLVAAPTPYVDKKSAVADEAWMNARVKAGEVLQSGQQLDPEGTLIDVSGRLLAIEFAQGGKVLVLKTTTTLATFEPESFKLIAKAEFPVAKGGGSMHGLAISAETLYERAGILDRRESGGEAEVVAAIQRATDLDDRQKQALIEVYHSMRRVPPDPGGTPEAGSEDQGS